MPATDEKAVVTEKQRKVREQFAAASLYAQSAISSPELKKEYQKKAPPGKTAHNMAFRDFLKAPVVKSINTGTYNGSPGSTIVVTAKDDFRVAEVKVNIYTALGAFVEEGNAILNPVDRNKWIYTATHTNPAVAGSNITATAKDLPGNIGHLEIGI